MTPSSHALFAGLLAALLAGAGCAAFERRAAQSARPVDPATETWEGRHREWRRCVQREEGSSLMTLKCGDEPLPPRP